MKGDAKGWLILGGLGLLLLLLNGQAEANRPYGILPGRGAVGGTRNQGFAPTTNRATQMLLSNNRRAGAAFFNGSQGNLYLRLGGGDATLSAYTVKLVPSAYYSIPAGYRGDVSGIWDIAGSGTAVVTEQNS
jgi:hypothetical protein